MSHVDHTGMSVFAAPSPSVRDKVLRFAGAGILAALLVGAASFLAAGTAWAGTSVKILSPADGATVDSPVSVTFAFHPEGKANHVHVIVDGDFIMKTTKSPVTVTLDKGPHTIMLRAATVHHHLLKAKSTIHVTVN